MNRKEKKGKRERRRDFSPFYLLVLLILSFLLSCLILEEREEDTYADSSVSCLPWHRT